MAAEYLTSWSPTVKTLIHQALLDYLGSFAIVTVHGMNDEVLVTVQTRSDPLATISSTGIIQFRFPISLVSVPTSGTASYATLRTSTGEAVRSMPCTVNSTLDGEFEISSTRDAPGGMVVVKSLAFLAGDSFMLTSMILW